MNINLNAAQKQNTEQSQLLYCTHTHTHACHADAGPPGEATEQSVVVLALLADVSMETVMSDLQTCALPSIWLRLANQITSTHTQMNCQITS